MNLLNHDKTALRIFENFEVDFNLPKHQTGMVDMVDSEHGSTPAPVSGVGGSRFLMRANGSSMWLEDTGPNESDRVEKLPRWKRWLLGKYKPKKEVYRYTVEEFFKSIKNSAAELKRVDERIESFNVILKQAQQFGQIALVEKMQDELEVIKSETQLYAIELTTIITEEQVVKFAKDSPKGLRLDWIKNFTRIIPSKLLTIKAKTDELKIFDNYVILHYDPENKNTEMTKKEIEKKKDPILFGVIAGSRKLYYLGDWIDEYCDLTLDKFIDKFGKETIDKNNITANIKGIVD